MAAFSKLIIHLVHGTWPCGWGKKARKRWDELRKRLDELRNGTLDPNHFWDELWWKDKLPRDHCWDELGKGRLARDRYWFVEGSSFCRDIECSFYQEIERSASSSIKFVTFTWSGKNTFTARHDAATKLRKHLKGYLCDIPNAYHVVVAHSHGGTVAFEAIANSPDNPEKWPQSLAGVLTMGTPFVALRKSSSQRAESSSQRAERIARVLARSWGAPLLLCFGVAFSTALALGPGEFLPAFALSIAIVSIGFIGMLAIPGNGFDWLKPGGLAELLAPTDPKLECPLIAYRAPGDEASFAISAAQITDWFFGRIVLGGLVLRPVACLKRMIKTWRARVSVTIWTMTSLAFIIYDRLFTEELQPLWFYLIAGPGYLMLFFLVLLMVVVPLILVPGMLFLGWVTGPEAGWYAEDATVDAESVPVGVPAKVEMLTDVHTMPLRHSLHELRVMREQIGKWLRQLCT